MELPEFLHDTYKILQGLLCENRGITPRSHHGRALRAKGISCLHTMTIVENREPQRLSAEHHTRFRQTDP